jgi:hypothetical protein
MRRVRRSVCISAERAPEVEGLSAVSDPEPDAYFRKRLLRVVAEKDRAAVEAAAGAYLDALGRKYDRFRTGVPLTGHEPGRFRS